jgi:DNA-binding NarL/FixJ family response regulator
MVVDDNRLAAEALERWFTSGGGFRWLGWTAEGAEVGPMVAERRPDVVLLDVDMPGVDCFAILERLVAEHPTVRVVMFSGHVRADYIERALAAGACGYVVKDEQVAAISDLLRRAAAGECVLSPAAAAAFMRAAR